MESTPHRPGGNPDGQRYQSSLMVAFDFIFKDQIDLTGPVRETQQFA